MISSILKKGALFSISFLFWFALNGQTSNGVIVVTHNLGPYAQANSKQTIYGSIENFSTEVVDQLQVFWQVDNSDIFVDTYSGLNLGNWTSFIFEHNNQWNVGNQGVYTLKLWIDNINGQALEEIDTLKTTVEALSQTAKRLVLLESFSSIDCASCAQINPSIREISQKYSERSFTIAYQIDCYTNNPMCHLAEDYIFDRVDLYNIVSTPNLVINPWYKGRSDEFLDMYFDAELERPSPIGITGNFSINNNQIEVECTFTPYTSISSENLVVKVAYTEDIVSFTSPPGGNGEAEFFHILRRFSTLPGYNIEPIANGNDILLNFYEDFNGLDVDLSKFRVAIFIQDTSTLEVIQTAELFNVQTGLNQPNSSNIKIFPNPTRNGFSITHDLFSSGAQSIKLIDSMGRVTYETSTNNYSNSIFIPTNDISPGVYIIWVSGPNFDSRERIVIL